MKSKSLIITFLLAVAGTAAQSQTTLQTGHTDISLAYDDSTSTWDMGIHLDATDQQFNASDVVLYAGPESQGTVSSDPRYSFLGAAGNNVWILPQVQNENLLYLGYGADDIANGVFVGDAVTVTLKNVTGPGNFYSYKVDAFGNPAVYFNTANGIDSSDSISVDAGGDSHLNWAFSQPGEYTMTLQTSGILADGNVSTASGEYTYTFQVVPEPSTTALAIIGGAGVVLAGYRKKLRGAMAS